MPGLKHKSRDWRSAPRFNKNKHLASTAKGAVIGGYLEGRISADQSIAVLGKSSGKELVYGAEIARERAYKAASPEEALHYLELSKRLHQKVVANTLCHPSQINPYPALSKSKLAFLPIDALWLTAGEPPTRLLMENAYRETVSAGKALVEEYIAKQGQVANRSGAAGKIGKMSLMGLTARASLDIGPESWHTEWAFLSDDFKNRIGSTISRKWDMGTSIDDDMITNPTYKIQVRNTPPEFNTYNRDESDDIKIIYMDPALKLEDETYVSCKIIGECALELSHGYMQTVSSRLDTRTQLLFDELG